MTLPPTFEDGNSLVMKQAADMGGAIHRHKKRGTEYVLIGIGKMQAEHWMEHYAGNQLPVDMREVAIYRSATDPTEIWVRPREEFEDGRFEILSGKAGGISDGSA